jgi:hypothetical protein
MPVEGRTLTSGVFFDDDEVEVIGDEPANA